MIIICGVPDSPLPRRQQANPLQGKTQFKNEVRMCRNFISVSKMLVITDGGSTAVRSKSKSG